MRRSWFHVARAGSPYRFLAVTLVQTVIFWALFLGLIPWLIISLEAYLQVPTIEWVGQRWLGSVLFGISGGLGLWSGVTMAWQGQGTPLPLACAARLVVAGPYAYLRNPMAVAGLTQGFAVGLAVGSVSVIWYVVAGMVIWDQAVRPSEEADLQERFGAAYRAYRADVNCWFPRLSPYRDSTMPS